MSASPAERGLAAPEGGELLESLSTLLGPSAAQHAIALASREAKVGPSPLESLALPELLALSEAMVRQRGLVSVLARAFSIRAKSFIAIERESSAGAS